MAASNPDWQPTASLTMARERARLLNRVRTFFQDREVLEVETPVLGRYGAMDPHLYSPRLLTGEYLQTSPEYHMKRLLAAGYGAIWQVARVFRGDESGRRHNPEFSMLEWYRPDYDMPALMDEVADLVQWVLGGERPEVRTYRELFLTCIGLDPWHDETQRLVEQAAECSGLSAASLDCDDALDVLISHVIEPYLAMQGRVFIIDYPPSQAALAQVRQDRDGLPVASRFELYIDGMELCNGYHELLDADEQRRRFEADALRRESLGHVPMATDERLLQALESGLPDCAGVALGLDRLLMCATGASDIRQTLNFPADRA